MQDFVSGDATAGIVWSGDITVLNAEAGFEKWKFALPSAGGTIFPNAETLANAHIFRTLNSADDQEFNAEFQRVKLGA
jgi:hypothetical protein